MLGRMVSASVVQDHLQGIINAVQGDSPLGPTELRAIEAGEDMSLLTIDSRDAKGIPTGITWTWLDPLNQ